jgi:hypothetical protein
LLVYQKIKIEKQLKKFVGVSVENKSSKAEKQRTYNKNAELGPTIGITTNKREPICGKRQ